MIKICEMNECTGCSACMNICPKLAITMQPDKWGVSHPVINTDKCVECQLCVKTCPNNAKEVISFHRPMQCYAAWMDDERKRKNCASGGVAAVLSELAMANGFHVFGTHWNDSLEPVVEQMSSETMESFKGSKYVQSQMGNVYREIKQLLDAQQNIVFIGTPCQIAGLYGYLNARPERLVTCDLVCHGVTPTSYLKQEVSHLQKSRRLTSITDIRFRSNDLSMDFHLGLWHNEKLQYLKSAYEQYYFCGFMKGITLRENCYQCHYARAERISDMTVGDFIGFDKSQIQNKKTHVSLFTLNTEKGVQLFESLNIKEQLSCLPQDYQVAVSQSPSLKAPFKRHCLNGLFKFLYPLLGYVSTSRVAIFPVVGYTEFHHYMHVMKTKCLGH